MKKSGIFFLGHIAQPYFSGCISVSLPPHGRDGLPYIRCGLISTVRTTQMCKQKPHLHRRRHIQRSKLTHSKTVILHKCVSRRPLRFLWLIKWREECEHHQPLRTDVWKSSEMAKRCIIFLQDSVEPLDNLTPTFSQTLKPGLSDSVH